MKKLTYVLLVLAALLVVAYALKGQKAEVATENDVANVEEVADAIATPAAVEEDTVVVVDEEPVSEEPEETAEDVEEDNPAATADEGETIVE